MIPSLGHFVCPPRPLPYDDPRCSGLNVNVLASRYKSSAAFVEESESFRADKNNGNSESTSLLDKWSGYNHGSSKKLSSECSLNHSSVETTGGATYMFPSSEEEDVCPTCLEEYTAENPRIILQCSHHFHLGCIYEWMERSNLCPVCGKVMVFNETS
ncbi:hypothetical protein HPP92_023596 [Vanilla planifolia]|uniref:RING-type E3 ubiquitin transferase n=1 Tax=Vanilla planifolia TaxID=51239 RepID=A0A835UD01_VANPL|nr:hypothetical protein HPP92_023596 [Vanilla planifolia]